MAKPKLKEPVAGYMFECVGGSYGDRDNTVCQVVARAGTDKEQLEEPCFLVEFGDGVQIEVMASELRPWYPT